MNEHPLKQNLNLMKFGGSGGAEPPGLDFFPQHIVEGLLNSRRRVSDRPSWILISKTPAKEIDQYCYCYSFLFVPRTRRWLIRVQRVKI